MPDNATLDEALNEARELNAVVKDASARLKALRALCKHLIDAGMGSDAQKKAAAIVFPPVGRKAGKK